MKRKLVQKVKITYVMLSAALLGLHACSEDDARQLSPTTESVVADISVNNGHLVFENRDIFDQTFTLLLSDQSKLNDWEQQFSNYQSMRSAFYAIEATDDNVDELLDKHKDIITVTDRLGEQEAIMIIDDRILATFFSNEGLLQIGDELYKAGYHSFYKINAKEQALFEGGIEAISARSNAAIEAIPVEREVYEFEAPTAVNAKRIETCETRYDKKGRKRVKGEVFTTKIGALYAGAGARTKHQRKRLGIWWRSRTKQIRLQVTGEFEQYFGQVSTGPIPVNYDSGWESDDGREAYTFEFCANVSCKFDIISMYGTHSCLCDDNVRRSCNTEITK